MTNMPLHELFDSLQGIVILGGVGFLIYDKIQLASRLKDEISKLSDSVAKLADVVSKLSERQAASEKAFEVYTSMRK